MNAPAYEYVPVLGSVGNATVRALRIVGLSTIHGDAFSDRGRLYASLAGPAGSYTLTLYADAAHTQPVSAGSVASLGTTFNLAATGGRAITGRAIVDAYTADEPNLLLMPTFAVDEDVQVIPQTAASLPGYDGQWGLGFFQARAARRIMAQDLPAKAPYLYGGGALAGMLPETGFGKLPDLSTIANVDQLREAQAWLVKFLCGMESAHVQEMRDLAKACMEAYQACMDEVAEANRHEREAGFKEQAQTESLSFGVFTREW